MYIYKWECMGNGHKQEKEWEEIESVSTCCEK